MIVLILQGDDNYDYDCAVDDRSAEKGGVVAAGPATPPPSSSSSCMYNVTLSEARISCAAILHDAIVDGRLGAEILAY